MVGGSYSANYGYGFRTLALVSGEPRNFSILFSDISRSFVTYHAFGSEINGASSHPSLCYSFKMKNLPNILTGGYAVAGFLTEDAAIVGFSLNEQGLLSVYSPDGYSPAIDINTIWSTSELNIVNILWNKPQKKVSVFINENLISELTYSGEAADPDLVVAGFCHRRTNYKWRVEFSQPLVTESNPGFYRFVRLTPASDIESEFTPDTGEASFSRINETPPDGDESYTAATDPGARAVFRYADASGNPLELGPNQGVLAIKHTVQARNEVPDARTLKSVYRKDGVDTATDDGIQVTGAYQLSSQSIETNPATGTAWQPEDFEDWAFGFQIEED